MMICLPIFILDLCFVGGQELPIGENKVFQIEVTRIFGWLPKDGNINLLYNFM